MLRFISILILSLFVSVSVNASSTTTTVVEKKTIITPAPKSVNCTTIPAHWEGSIWVDTQSVCKYENRREGVAWVQDYWTCSEYNASSGECTTWEYKPGHWVKTLP